MAIHKCASGDKCLSGGTFERNVKGRPPRQCPQCIAAGIRIAKPLPTPRPLPVPKTSEDYQYGEAWDELPTDEHVTDEDITEYQSLIRERDETKSSQSVGMLESVMLDLIKANMPKIDESSVKSIVDGAISQFVAHELPAQIRSAGVERIELAINGEVKPLPDTAHKMLPKLIQVLSTGEHVFMPGPAGSGKSHLAEQAAILMEMDFASLSLGPTTQPNKLFGYMEATGNYVSTPFRKVYENGGIFLLDEMDNGHPGILAELNQALANGYAAFADGMVRVHNTFRCIATGNTFGKGPDRLFVGRNILDAATLDRFTTVEVAYDEALETKLAMAYATDGTQVEIQRWVSYVQQVRANAADRKLAVIVSPRSTIAGAKMLAVGMSVEDAKEMRLFAGIKEDVREQIG